MDIAFFSAKRNDDTDQDEKGATLAYKKFDQAASSMVVTQQGYCRQRLLFVLRTSGSWHCWW